MTQYNPMIGREVIRRRDFKRRQTGATLVEYAFVLILFLSLLFGISGFGHALYTYHYINNAAKEATRYASVRGFTCNTTEAVSSCQTTNSASGISGPTTLSDVQSFIQSITPSSISYSSFTITACGVKGQAVCTESIPAVCSAAVGTLPATPNYPGCTVKVTVTYPYTFIFPFIRTTPFNMGSTSEMIIVH